MRETANLSRSAATFALALSIPLPFGASSLQAWQLKTLYEFKDDSDGGGPRNLVREISTGSFYGTASGGEGCTELYCWQIFKLWPNEKKTVLHLVNAHEDGFSPASLLKDASGNLYGTTSEGGNIPCGGGDQRGGCGVIFKLAPDGTYTVLHRLKNDNGTSPHGLVLDAKTGDLFGAAYGDQSNKGTVFKLTTDGTFTILHTFDGSDGEDPVGRLLRDRDGSLYGTTRYGGDPACDCGTIYKIAPDGNFALLYVFPKEGLGYPNSGVVNDALGNLYGTALRGRNKAGLVYKLTPDGHFGILHKFREPPWRTHPSGDLLLDRSGAIYGAIVESQSTGSWVYQMDFQTGAYELLHTFQHATPTGGLLHDKDGNLYGATGTYGVPNNGFIFELVK